MASQKKTKANRRNSKKSTGPQTKAGKQVASQNALKHGLLASRALLPSDDEAIFEHFAQETREIYGSTENPEAALLVDKLIALRWRLQRVVGLQTEIMDPSAKAPLAQTLLSLMIRYERDLERVFNKTREQLKEKQQAETVRIVEVPKIVGIVEGLDMRGI